MFPLLFLLIIEGLIKLIEEARDKGDVKGIDIFSIIIITHLLLVDDVMLFEMAHWRNGKYISSSWKNYVMP